MLAHFIKLLVGSGGLPSLLAGVVQLWFLVQVQGSVTQVQGSVTQEQGSGEPVEGNLLRRV